jgi:preprotein translocase subunit SecE
MGKEKSLTFKSFLVDLFQTGVYKRTQGRIARQVTFAVVMVAAVIGAWRMWISIGPAVEYSEQAWSSAGFLPALWMHIRAWPFTQHVVAGALMAAGLWFGYRLVNIPQLADFLIAVEAEMNKVSWPSRGELVRSALVVILVIFLLAAVLFVFDLVWRSLFVFIGVRPG